MTIFWLHWANIIRTTFTYLLFCATAIKFKTTYVAYFTFIFVGQCYPGQTWDLFRFPSQEASTSRKCWKREGWPYKKYRTNLHLFFNLWVTGTASIPHMWPKNVVGYRAAKRAGCGLQEPLRYDFLRRVGCGSLGSSEHNFFCVQMKAII
jgi:hypothetical protein